MATTLIASPCRLRSTLNRAHPLPHPPLQEYIDDHLMAELPGGGQLTHAAILGHDGGVWASSPDFPEVSEEEVENIMKGFDDAGALAVNGLRIGGEKYMVVAGEPGEAIRGKKGAGAERGEGLVWAGTAALAWVGQWRPGA